MRFVALLLAVLAGSLGAQSVNPPIAVYEGGGTRAKGSFVVDNPTIYPITWVVEPKSFQVACTGDMTFAPVDTAAMRLRLSAMSGRLAARQRTTVFYEIEVDSVPAWLALVVALAPGRPQPGLNIKLEIPHIVYVMQRDPVRSGDVVIDRAEFDTASRVLRVRVTSHSAGLTRITDLRVRGKSGSERSLEACPLFPNATREFTFPWSGTELPSLVSIKFSSFGLDQRVALVARPPADSRGPACGTCLR